MDFLELYGLVYDHFKDHTKTRLWFESENPLLGNISPMDMVKFGRIEKLEKFIKNCLEGDY